MLLRHSKIILQLRQTYLCPVQALCTTVTNTPKPTGNVESDEGKEVSKAMRAYLERAREHTEFMRLQNHEFQIGKRHLANMMGEDPETFTQADIDRAVEYLFPSGLFEKKARPLMKPPEEVFPQRKAAEFDETGRPFHFLFYTAKPNFYKLLYDVVSNMNELHKFEDVMIRKNNVPDPNLAIQTSGYQWLDQEALENKLVETLNDKDYSSFLTAMDRLVALPYSYKCLDFINQYRKPLLNQTKTFDVPELKYDDDGRSYITTYECLRKRARGHVTIRSPGTGAVTINDQDIRYFWDIQSREQDEASNFESTSTVETRLGKIQQSVVAQHCHESGHTMNVDDVKMLARAGNYYRRLIREAIEIYKHPQNINREDGTDISRVLKLILTRPGGNTHGSGSSRCAQRAVNLAI